MDCLPPTARPTRAEIDLAALRHNLRQVRAQARPEQGVMAVVKANAYGHGAVAVSQFLQEEGVACFAVATLEEALELRAARIERPILVLGGCYAGQEAAFVEYSLTAVVMSLADLRRLQAYTSQQQVSLAVHLKWDTGMGRVGFLPHELSALVESLRGNSGIEVAGLMTHFACADELSNDFTSDQISIFSQIIAELKAVGIAPPAIHAGNSAGLVAWDFPEATLVRPGIILYGGYPAAGFQVRLDLQPVMSLITQIAQLRTLDAGSGISYGQTHRTSREARLATLPIGYADGYNRLFSNAGEVLVRGQRAPVVGRVCMDWVLVDVTAIDGATIGDRVVLLGCDGDERISAEDWAAKLDTINYEVFCRIAPRVPRSTLAATPHS